MGSELVKFSDNLVREAETHRSAKIGKKDMHTVMELHAQRKTGGRRDRCAVKDVGSVHQLE